MAEFAFNEHMATSVGAARICPVDVADVVMTGLAVHRNGVDVLHLAAHDVTGSMGSFDRYIEYRMHDVKSS